MKARYRTLLRYSLLQIPGLVVIGLVVWFLWERETISFLLAAGVWLGWLIKDILLYPIVKDSYGEGGKHGRDKLIGESGVVVQALGPEGFVRVRGELWQARIMDLSTVHENDAPGVEGRLPEGVRIRVHRAEGMLLDVRRLEEEEENSTDDFQATRLES